ncbi:hypothetical protein AMAG_12661 [Allomyces macrogynus ATCC 38327]|uniref:Zinc/iron permease n=1 Tax=Allomyces macrogynus (strain ATCC 38327) TaxID=578462 RepID=A0A0L0T1I8_ALLM3|nr:hypothetical protein AMAG_12661 [Allomyces macrogynus ATCC 38327]|eukprot:KNE68485.1 hypothetical protein AMAG_12661 [Allomyces macrogynus ATCC 38327]
MLSPPPRSARPASPRRSRYHSTKLAATTTLAIPILLSLPPSALAHGGHVLELPAVVKDLLSDAHATPVLAACTTILALGPLVMVTVLPRNMPPALERVLISFALGTLLGDVFLHLVPDVLGGGHGHDDHHGHNHHGLDHHGHDHHHDHAHAHDGHSHGSSAALKLVAGFLAFYLVERIMGVLMTVSSSSASHDHSQAHDHKHDHNHDHDHDYDHADESTSTATASPSKPRRRRRGASRTKRSVSCAPAPPTPPARRTASPAAYLHVVASSVHTFSDGLLLALSFAHSAATGLSTFLALALHEVPHRLADWTLLQSMGMNRNAALRAQVVVSAAASAGVAAGKWLIPAGAVESVMPVLAGGLVYVATVGVVPELVGHHHHHGDGHGHGRGHQHAHDAHRPSVVKKVVQLVVEMGAVVAGVALMHQFA